MLRALIWDVDGTIAETERDGHRVAFNRAFQEVGVPWVWDVAEYGRLLWVAGGLERLLHDMQSRAQAPRDPALRERLARTLHRRKNQHYAEIVAAGGIGLRPGVRRLLDECAGAGLVQAVATTTSRANVETLFASQLGSAWRERFAAIVCAEDAPARKPDPLVYHVVLDRLGIAAGDTLALEDSPIGLAAANGAGVAAVITRSAYFAEESFTGCAGMCDDLDKPLSWQGGAAVRTDLAALRALNSARGGAPGGRRAPG
jgi:HAD superfamily hydrolase (TIGR01509 family)